MLVENFQVQSDDVSYESDCIRSRYEYRDTSAELTEDGTWTVRPSTSTYEFRTQTRLPKLGYVSKSKSQLLDSPMSRSCFHPRDQDACQDLTSNA
jgi:hypothetical protein